MQLFQPWLIAGGVLFYQATLPTGDEVEKAILRHRSAIVRGSAKIRVVRTVGRDGHRRETIVHHWFDGARVREDRFWTKADGSSETIRDVYCWHCPQQGYGFHWTSDRPPGGPVAATIDRLERRGTVIADMKPIDLRVVGLVTEWLLVLHYPPLQSLFTQPKKSSPEVTAAVLNNEPCLLLSYLDHFGREMKIWCSPEKQYNVLQMKLKDVSRDRGESGDSEIELRNELEKVGSQGIWFPKRVVLSYYRNGAVEEQEIAELMDLTLNDPLPPETFAVSGFGIPDGTPVISELHPTQVGMFTEVEGGEIRTFKGKVYVPGQIVVKEKRKPRWAVYGAIGAGVLAVVLVGYYVFRRRSGTV